MIKSLKKFFAERAYHSIKNRNNYDKELEQFVSRRINSKVSASKTLNHENELLKNLAGLRGSLAVDTCPTSTGTR